MLNKYQSILRPRSVHVAAVLGFLATVLALSPAPMAKMHGGVSINVALPPSIHVSVGNRYDNRDRGWNDRSSADRNDEWRDQAYNDRNQNWNRGNSDRRWDDRQAYAQTRSSERDSNWDRGRGQGPNWDRGRNDRERSGGGDHGNNHKHGR